MATKKRSRPRKLRDSDRLMLASLRDGGLPIHNPLQLPWGKTLVDTDRYFWLQGIPPLMCCYSKLSWAQWPPEEKPRGRRRGRPAMTTLPSVPVDGRKRQIEAAHRQTRSFVYRLAIATRLNEYALVPGALYDVDAVGYERNDTLHDIRKAFKNHPLAQPGVAQWDDSIERFLEEIDLPKRES